MSTETRELHFYGGSDDLCEVEGDVKGADEYCTDGGAEGKHAFAFIVRRGWSPGCDDGEIEALRVNALYDGTWSFAVGKVDEDVPLPPWPIRIEQSTECSYSTLLALTVPADVEVVRDSPRY